VAGIAYLAAIREFLQTPRYSRKVIFACLALAVLWRVPFLSKPSPSGDDVRRYVWDGRLQRLGYNPYDVVPGDPASAALHTPETREINNPDVPSPYPPGAQVFFRAITAIHESVFAFKVAFLACDLAIIVVLFEALRRSGQAEHWVLAYAWHPLLATEVASSGHIDIFGVLLLVVSAAALKRSWRGFAAVTFGLAIAVKFLPLVLLPLYWRRLRIRDAMLGILAFALPYLLFLRAGRIPIGSLGVYVQRFRFNDLVFAMLERAASPRLAVGLAVLVGLGVAAWLRSRPPVNWEDPWAWPMAASLACAPVVYPWYLLWLLPFLRSVSTLPLVVWTVSILSTYLVWYLHSFGHAWQVPAWVLLLEYGSVGMTAAVMLLRQLR
jgi:hypothetical protein